MMKKVLAFILLLVVTCFSNSCSSKTESKQENSTQNNSYSRPNSDEYEHEKTETNSYNKPNDEESEINNEYSSACKFEDDTYSATVDYNNPETGYSATYTLDVEVEDCQVVQINFPNDGYLDEDHISAADLDEDGNAMIDGEEGKTYQIQIDN